MLFLQLFTLVEEVLVEVFKASPQDRAQQRLVVQTTSFLQLFTLVKDVLVEVFKASSQGQSSTSVSGADYVDTAVHSRGGGARGGLSGLSQGQCSSAVCGAEHVDTPVPHGRVGKRGLRGFHRGQFPTASAGKQTIVPARGGLHEGLQGGGSFGGPQDSPEDWEYGDFDPEVMAEAERQIEARLSERLEQSHPGAWAVATDPQGQTYFWHRRSRRVRWTLPPGASCS